MPPFIAKLIAEAISTKVLNAEAVVELVRALGSVVDSKAAGEIWAEVVHIADALHSHVHEPGAGFGAPIPAPLSQGSQHAEAPVTPAPTHES